MKKKCEKCGKEFEARQPHYKFCLDCISLSKYKQRYPPPELLLKTYYDRVGNLLKEVFIGVPQELANIFAEDGLSINQLRDFHYRIWRARTKANLKGIETAKSILYESYKDVEYQLKRQRIPQSFVQFMKHHLALAEKNENSLEGFFQHLDSIVCYFPSKKGGG